MFVFITNSRDVREVARISRPDPEYIPITHVPDR